MIKTGIEVAVTADSKELTELSKKFKDVDKKGTELQKTLKLFEKQVKDSENASQRFTKTIKDAEGNLSRLSLSTNKAGQTIGKLSTRVKNADGSFSTFSKNIGETSQKVSSFSSIVSQTPLGSFTSSISSMGAASVLAGASVTALAGGLSAALVGSVKTTSQMEILQTRLNTLTKGKGEQTLAELNEWALTQPVSVSKVVDIYSKLQSFGLNPTIDKMQILLDTSVAFGGQSDTMDGIAIAIGQIASKGKVAAEELNQLAERGIPAKEILANGLGVATSELDELLRKGVDADKALEILFNGLKERAGGGALAAMKTLNGQWDLFKENISNSLGEFNKAIGLNEKLRDVLTEVNERAIVKRQLGTTKGEIVQGIIAPTQITLDRSQYGEAKKLLEKSLDELEDIVKKRQNKLLFSPFRASDFKDQVKKTDELLGKIAYLKDIDAIKEGEKHTQRLEAQVKKDLETQKKKAKEESKLAQSSTRGEQLRTLALYRKEVARIKKELVEGKEIQEIQVKLVDRTDLTDIKKSVLPLIQEARNKEVERIKAELISGKGIEEIQVKLVDKSELESIRIEVLPVLEEKQKKKVEEFYYDSQKNAALQAEKKKNNEVVNNIVSNVLLESKLREEQARKSAVENLDIFYKRKKDLEEKQIRDSFKLQIALLKKKNQLSTQDEIALGLVESAQQNALKFGGGNPLSQAVDQFIGAIKEIESLLNKPKEIVDALTSLFNTLANLGQEFKQSLIDFEKSVENAGKNFSEIISQGLTSAVRLLANSPDIIADFADALEEGLIDSFPAFVDELVQGADKFVQRLAERAPEVFSKVLGGFNTLDISLALGNAVKDGLFQVFGRGSQTIERNRASSSELKSIEALLSRVDSSSVSMADFQKLEDERKALSTSSNSYYTDSISLFEKQFSMLEQINQKESELLSAFEGLSGTIKVLSGREFSLALPAAELATQQRDIALLFEKAKTGTTEERVESFKEINKNLPDLLKNAQKLFSSSSTYQQIYTSSMQQLRELQASLPELSTKEERTSIRGVLVEDLKHLKTTGEQGTSEQIQNMDLLGKYFEELKNALLMPLNQLVSWMNTIYQAILSGVNTIKDGIVLAINSFWAASIQWFNTIWQSILNAANTIKDAITNAANSIKDWFLDYIKRLEDVYLYLSNIKDKITNIETYSSSILGAINSLKLVADDMKSYLVSINSVLKSIQSATPGTGSGGFLGILANGGLISGNSHAMGGVPATVGGYKNIELEGGEYVINKKSTSLIGTEYLDKLNKVGKGSGHKFRNGGNVSNSNLGLDRIQASNQNILITVEVDGGQLDSRIKKISTGTTASLLSRSGTINRIPERYAI